VSIRDRLVRMALRTYARLPRGVRRRVVRLGAPTFVVGSMGAVVIDGDVLLVRQSYRDGWGLPGGLLDRGEAADAAVVREIHEEAGLAVVVDGTAAVVVEPQLRRVDVCFRCSLAPGSHRDEARPSSPEIVEVRWAPVDGMADLQPEAVRGLRELGFEVPDDAGVSQRPRRTRS
jgi:8-oxo-dGTP pyrophosphatase MutT (NUDIX family)